MRTSIKILYLGLIAHGQMFAYSVDTACTRALVSASVLQSAVTDAPHFHRLYQARNAIAENPSELWTHKATLAKGYSLIENLRFLTHRTPGRLQGIAQANILSCGAQLWDQRAKLQEAYSKEPKNFFLDIMLPANQNHLLARNAAMLAIPLAVSIYLWFNPGSSRSKDNE
jgi:hypothetical protein